LGQVGSANGLPQPPKDYGIKRHSVFVFPFGGIKGGYLFRFLLVALSTCPSELLINFLLCTSNFVLSLGIVWHFVHYRFAIFQFQFCQHWHLVGISAG